MKNLVISGDTRFDRVYSIAQQTNKFPLIQKFVGQHKVLLAGSTWSPGESLIHHLLSDDNETKLIIAPHEVHEERIKSIQKLFNNKKTIRYSSADEDNIKLAEVLIIDQIGILSGLYQYCNIAYIGGGFGRGIHNILEAATFGKPIIMGPNYHKFKEAVDLIKLGGAFSVSNENEFKSEFSKLIEDDEYYSRASSICQTFIAENKGATDKILKKLSGYVK